MLTASSEDYLATACAQASLAAPSAMSGGAPSTMPPDVVRAEIARLENSVKHLRRSNEQLAEALEEDPAEEEFKSAIEENVGVIARQESEIRKLQDLLRAAGVDGIPADHAPEPAQPPAPPPAARAQEEQEREGEGRTDRGSADGVADGFTDGVADDDDGGGIFL